MKAIKLFLPIAFIILLSACSQTTETANLSENKKFESLIELEQSFQDNKTPKNELTDLSPEKLALDHQELNRIYQRIIQINVEELSPEHQINWSILTYRTKNKIDSYLNKEHYMPLTAESGFHVYLSWGIGSGNFKTIEDYKFYIQKLASVKTYFQQQMAWMNKGIVEGITQPQIVLDGFEDSIKTFIKDDVTQSSFYKPFNTMPAHIKSEQAEQLKMQAQAIISEQIIPSYQEYYDYMVNTYKPNARTNIAANSLPNGKDYYQNRVNHYTTLEMSADEIHSVGLNEVKRIKAEMMAIIKEVNFDGSFADFVEFLRTDEQFYAKTPEGLLKEASYIAKKMDAKLPSLFKTLPRTPYGVIEVPANIAPKYTTGRYSGPSRDDQPGNYWVNTYRLDRRPLYVLEALTLHEAVPGHHLQGSIAREMKNVPKFRNHTYISAFGEGWGLYSEYLGLEAGFYQDPYSNFGRLTYEMWRACRLVVDTGMHAKGWSREKAMDFLASNTALSLHNVKTEIDRYISWPGQALSYKMGELTIKKLRKETELALGENFDIRDFHDQILKQGSMPLAMLEKVISQYIEEKTKENKS